MSRVGQRLELALLLGRSHGTLCQHTLDSVERALELAPDDALVTILLHHHVVPLPVEGLGEWFAEKFGWPHAAELPPLGRELLRRVSGRCDLVLHGHRHVPWHFRFTGARPLQVFNAGSSTELGAFRVFYHEGSTLQAPVWHAAQAHLNHDQTAFEEQVTGSTATSGGGSPVAPLRRLGPEHTQWHVKEDDPLHAREPSGVPGVSRASTCRPRPSDRPRRLSRRPASGSRPRSLKRFQRGPRRGPRLGLRGERLWRNACRVAT